MNHEYSKIIKKFEYIKVVGENLYVPAKCILEVIHFLKNQDLFIYSIEVFHFKQNGQKEPNLDYIADYSNLFNSTNRVVEGYHLSLSFVMEAIKVLGDEIYFCVDFCK